MAERVTRKRRESLQLQAERMRAAKAQRTASVQETLDNVPVDLIRKYFRRVREYARGYGEGFAAGPALERTVKQYKSHRRVSELEVMNLF